MTSLATYFSMGGYAAFVWPSYALTAVVMVGLVVVTWRGLKAREAELKALQDVMPRRRARTHEGQGQ